MSLLALSLLIFIAVPEVSGALFHRYISCLVGQVVVCPATQGKGNLHHMHWKEFLPPLIYQNVLLENEIQCNLLIFSWSTLSFHLIDLYLEAFNMLFMFLYYSCYPLFFLHFFPDSVPHLRDLLATVQ